MSDHEPEFELDQDTLDAIRARDVRIAAVTDAIDVQAELRDNKSLKLVLQRLTDDATAAMMQFAFVDLSDHKAVMGLQARVFCMMYLDRVLRNVQQRGQVAEAQLSEEERT